MRWKIEQLHQRKPCDAPVSMRFTLWLLALLVGLALAVLPTSCTETRTGAYSPAVVRAQAR